MRQRRRTYRAHGRVNPYMSSPCHIELIISEKASGVKAEGVRRGEGAPRAQPGAGEEPPGGLACIAYMCTQCAWMCVRCSQAKMHACMVHRFPTCGCQSMHRRMPHMAGVVMPSWECVPCMLFKCRLFPLSAVCNTLWLCAQAMRRHPPARACSHAWQHQQVAWSGPCACIRYEACVACPP